MIEVHSNEVIVNFKFWLACNHLSINTKDHGLIPEMMERMTKHVSGIIVSQYGWDSFERGSSARNVGGGVILIGMLL